MVKDVVHVFQRYGNLHGKLGNHSLFPGWIDPKDLRYVYCAKPPTTRYIPYTNEGVESLQLLATVIPVSQLKICFKQLVSGRIPTLVQNRLSQLYPVDSHLQ